MNNKTLEVWVVGDFENGKTFVLARDCHVSEKFLKKYGYVKATLIIERKAKRKKKCAQ